jgi:hypothetical protein
MAPAVFLMMLALAIAGSGKSAAQRPISAHEPVSLAVSVSAGAIASPIGFAAASQEFSEPS